MSLANLQGALDSAVTQDSCLCGYKYVNMLRKVWLNVMQRGHQIELCLVM